MADVVRAFSVEAQLSGEVRGIIAAHVRLKCYEDRRWFAWLMGTKFIVTGPAASIDMVAAEIEKLEYEWWSSNQW